MRNCHRAALLLAVAVLLVSGICTAAGVVFPPENSCTKTLTRGGECIGKACQDSCFSQYRGDGRCNLLDCQCTYKCNPPPGHTPKAGPVGPGAGQH